MSVVTVGVILRQLDEDALLKVLDERGLVDQVMKTLDLSPTTRGCVGDESRGLVSDTMLVDEGQNEHVTFPPQYRHPPKLQSPKVEGEENMIFIKCSL